MSQLDYKQKYIFFFDKVVYRFQYSTYFFLLSHSIEKRFGLILGFMQAIQEMIVGLGLVGINDDPIVSVEVLIRMICLWHNSVYIQIYAHRIQSPFMH